MSHTIVDGMNVIGARPTGWWRDRPGAMRSLIARLQALAQAEPGAITVVLDGRPLPDLPEGEHGGVRVLYAPRRGPNAADDRIVELVAAAARPGDLCLFSSDRELRRRVEALGATVQGASRLLDRLDRVAQQRPE